MTKVIRATTTTTTGTKTPDTTQPLAAGALTANRAGGVAYVTSDREATLSYLMTGGFGATYYVDQKTHETEARNLFARAAASDTEWFAKAAVYARREGYMRSMPVLALSYLSTAADKRYFQSAFGAIIQTPGDLADFVKLTRGDGRVRGSSRTVRRAVSAWLEMLTPYHVIKYGSESQTMSLRDIYRLSHPNLVSQEAKAIATYVVKGTVTDALPTQLKGYVTFKQAEDTLPNLLLGVAEHRLPWEVVTGQLGGGDAEEKTLVWRAMSEQMPYMALLRNLNNLAKYGVLDSASDRQRVLGVLSDPERVKTSKQFPFRFISAIRAFDGSDAKPHIKQEVSKALRGALDASVGNMPSLGTTLVALDVSGSMSTASINGGPRYGRTVSDVTAADIGSVFAAALYKGSADATMLTFDTSVQDETSRLHREMSVYDIAQAINRQGGGTSLSEPIAAALKRTERYDTMVFITDSESWADAMKGDGSYSWRYNGTRTQELLSQYRENVNPNLKVFFLQLVPTTTKQTPQDVPNTFYTFGWSEQVLRYIAYQTNGTQNDAVLATSLTL